MGLSGTGVAGTGLADLEALFPREVAIRQWTVEGGGLREATLGLRIGAHGELMMEVPRAVAGRLPAGATGFALAALVAAAVGCPAWVAVAGGSVARRAAVGTVAVAVAIVAFQGVAAGRVPAWVLVVAPLVLMGDAVLTGARARDERPGPA